ncbi:MAG: hypothetical protein U0U67_08935 [Chitinophagales bacterium]
MSYDIYFIKRKDLTSNNIETILESDVTKSDQHFVSKQIMHEIKNKLIQQGLKFEVFEKTDEDYLELNFPTYQVSMFNSQFAISVPYWDSNSDDGINNEIKIITNTLLDNGFTGYDPQTEEFIVTKYEFRKSFTESKTVADKTLKNHTDNNLNYKYIGIGIAVIVIGIIIWKLLK